MSEWQRFHGILAATPQDALVAAAANSKLKEIKLLLQDGVDINGRDSAFKRTALGAAASLGLTGSVKLLISLKADLNVTDGNGLTPLMKACSAGLVKGSKVAMMLIEAGADVHYVRSSDEMTALKFAAKSCTPEVIQALIDRGADIDGPPGTDLTALMMAARENHVQAIAVLLKNGANPDLKCALPWAQGRTAEGLAELEGRKDAQNYLRAMRNPAK